MSRTAYSVLVLPLLVAAVDPVGAATRKVRVPNRYDGEWSIVATTATGPCSPSTSYQVQIKDSDASIPDQDVGIDGGVSSGGAVKATITRGSNKVPITGSLDSKGSGSGTWRTLGGLAECNGSWSAQRKGWEHRCTALQPSFCKCFHRGFAEI